MTRNHRWFPLVLVTVLVSGCQAGQSPELAVARTDTATEVALFGLVSWASHDDGRQIFALMPETSAAPQCLGAETPAPMRHYPVLKIVTGSFAWNGGNALPLFQGQPKIFSISGQDVTIDHGAFPTLRPEDFHLLSSDGRLEALRSRDYADPVQVDLDRTLLGDLGGGDARLATRVLFERGTVKARISDYCEYEPSVYLAEANTVGAGPPETGCPLDEDIEPENLAEEVVAMMSDAGETLTLYFHEWSSSEDRTLVVTPTAPGEGVRVELSHQMMDAAKEPDSRAPNEVLCEKDYLQDYLWYYDLRASPALACADLRPAFFPCYASEVGGTKCPEHDWGP